MTEIPTSHPIGERICSFVSVHPERGGRAGGSEGSDRGAGSRHLPPTLRVATTSDRESRDSCKLQRDVAKWHAADTFAGQNPPAGREADRSDLSLLVIGAMLRDRHVFVPELFHSLLTESWIAWIASALPYLMLSPPFICSRSTYERTCPFQPHYCRVARNTRARRYCGGPVMRDHQRQYDHCYCGQPLEWQPMLRAGLTPPAPRP